MNERVSLLQTCKESREKLGRLVEEGYVYIADHTFIFEICRFMQSLHCTRSPVRRNFLFLQGIVQRCYYYWVYRRVCHMCV